MENTLPIAFGVLAVFACVGFFLNYRFLAYVREKYPDRWNELGSPSVLMPNSVKINLAVMSFLWRGKYLEIGDGYLTKLCGWLRVFSLAYLVLFGVVVALFCVVISSGNVPKG
jgi:hypothetical protein